MTHAPNEDHFRKLEKVYASAPINRYFAPALRVSHGAAEIEMQVRPDFFHAGHAVHGSIYFKALDDAAFFAANSMVTDVFLLTATFNVFLLRPVGEGTMIARGTLLHHSRNLFLAEAILTSGEKQIARGTGTFMRSAILLNEDVGYV